MLIYERPQSFSRKFQAMCRVWSLVYLYMLINRALSLTRTGTSDLLCHPKSIGKKKLVLQLK